MTQMQAQSLIEALNHLVTELEKLNATLNKGGEDGK